MTDLSSITVTILTKNSEKYLDAVLSSVRDFGEVVIYDTGSTDRTHALTKEYSNVTVHYGPFVGFGATHNQASALAKNDWIFSLDSDELLSVEGLEVLRDLTLQSGSVYSFPRHNYYNGKWIKGCGWYPDRVKRLYNRQNTAFDGAKVHESVISEGLQLIDLEAPIVHYSYGSSRDFLEKMQSYSTLFAEQNLGIKESSFSKAVLHSLAAFFKSYLLKWGIRDGKEGFIISLYNANTTFYKYLKLAELTSCKTRLCPEEKETACNFSSGIQT